MQIKSKGILSATQVSKSLIANDWPLVQLIESVDFNATGNLTANGLIIRSIYVEDSALTGQTSANNIVADSITANIWYNLATGLIPGDNIGIEANGRISASSIATVVNDNQTFTASNTSQYTMNRSISDAKNILVMIEGLIQIPGIDYSVAGAALTFSTPPPIGAKIEVRFFGTDAYNYSVTSSLIAVNNLFDGDGSSDTFVLSLAPASKDYLTVNIDGVIQLPTSYELEGRTLTFTGIPTSGANIGVQILSTVTGTTFSTRSYTGDGTTNTYVVSSGFSADTILVFEDGIAKLPGTDYTYDGGNINFTYAPNADVQIQIRELGVRTDAGGNVISLLKGQDQVTGNLLPKYPGPYNIGNVNMPYNDIFVNNVIVTGSVTIDNEKVKTDIDFNPLSFMLGGM